MRSTQFNSDSLNPRFSYKNLQLILKYSLSSVSSSPRGAEGKDNIFKKLELFPQLQNATEHCFPTIPESVPIVVKKFTSSL